MYSFAILSIKRSLHWWYSYCCSHQAVSSVIVAAESFDANSIVTTMATSIIMQTVLRPFQTKLCCNTMTSGVNHWRRQIGQLIRALSIPFFHNLFCALDQAEIAKVEYDRMMAAYQASMLLVCIYAYRLNQPFRNCHWLQIIWMQSLRQRS